MNKESLVERLRQGTVSVTFTKADGSNRVMKCTLVPVWPKDKSPKEGDAGQSRNDDLDNPLVTVWDLEKRDWRAFSVDRVVSVDG